MTLQSLDDHNADRQEAHTASEPLRTVGIPMGIVCPNENCDGELVYPPPSMNCPRRKRASPPDTPSSALRRSATSPVTPSSSTLGPSCDTLLLSGGPA